MAELHLQELMAPTWRQRVRADYFLDRALRGVNQDNPEQDAFLPWTGDIMTEIRELKPSPEEFLSALVQFWAEVALQEHRRWSSKPVTVDAELAARLASPSGKQFPMTPEVPPEMVIPVNCRGAWHLVSRLGPYVPLIENQLLACLEHPDSLVHDAAVCAFGTVDAISDEAYRACLAYADRHGYGGSRWEAGAVLHKHTHGARIALVLEGLVPGVSRLVSSARFGVIRLFYGNDAEAARNYLEAQLGGEWTNGQLADLVHTLRVLCARCGFDAEIVAKVKTLSARFDYQVKCAAVQFLTQHSPQVHHDLLQRILVRLQMDIQISREERAWMLMGICKGLATHADVMPDLLRRAVMLGLGNYDACDGAPHCYAAALAGSSPANAQAALPEVVAWWQTVSGTDYLHINFDAIEEVLNTAEALGPAGAPLKPWLERALEFWLADDEQELDETDEIRSAEKCVTSPRFMTLSNNQARREAQMREYLPEIYAECKSGVAEGENSAADYYEDPLVVRLREAIAQLDA